MFWVFFQLYSHLCLWVLKLTKVNCRGMKFYEGMYFSRQKKKKKERRRRRERQQWCGWSGSRAKIRRGFNWQNEELLRVGGEFSSPWFLYKNLVNDFCFSFSCLYVVGFVFSFFKSNPLFSYERPIRTRQSYSFCSLQLVLSLLP